MRAKSVLVVTRSFALLLVRRGPSFMAGLG